MSRINFSTIKPATINALASYYFGNLHLDTINATYRRKIKATKDALKEAQEANNEADIIRLSNDMSILEDDRIKAITPIQEAIEKAIEKIAIPDSLYKGYLAFMKTGSMESGATIIMGKGKNATKVNTPSFIKVMTEYFEGMGASATDKGNIRKELRLMIAHTSGLDKAKARFDKDMNLTENSLIKVKSQDKFNDLFIRDFIARHIVNNAAFTVNMDKGKFEITKF